jgi:C4-dicarboxylate transporter DctQ subunit
MSESTTGGFKGLINHIEEGVLAFLLAFMTVLTFIQVVLRYLFNTGWVWSLEATTYSFGAMILIGMSYGVRTKSHIAVDLFTNKLPPKVRHYVALLAVIFCLIYAGLMLYGSGVFVDRLMMLGNMARDIPAPKWVLTAVMPLGFLLLGFRFLEAGWHVLKGIDSDMEFDEHGEHDIPSLIDDENNNNEGEDK